MNIFDFEKSFITDDHEGASALYADLQDSIKALAEFQRRQEQDENALQVNEDEATTRKYALLLEKVKRNTAAYMKANKGYHFLDKGNRRYENCRLLLDFLSKPDKDLEEAGIAGDHAIQPDYNKMGFDRKVNADNLDISTKAAMIALKDSESISPEARSDAEKEQYIKENKGLKDVLKAIEADDIAFAYSYTKNMQTLKNLEAYAEGRNEDIKNDVAAYMRYFETRAKMLANPVHSILKNANVKMDEQVERSLYYIDHKNYASEDKRDYELCRNELKRLQNEKKIGIKANATKGQKKWMMGSVGSKTLSGSMSAAVLKYSKNKALPGSDASVKFRLGKMGAKFDTKFFKASGSINLVSGRAKLGYAADNVVSSLTNLNMRSVGTNANASGYLAKARAKVKIGGKNNNFSVGAFVEGGSATAMAAGSAGQVIVTEKDDAGVETKHTELGFGYVAKAGIYGMAYGGSAGISILGVKINLTFKGVVGGLSGTSSGTFTSGRFAFSLGAALGLGAEVGMSIDWSGVRKKAMGFFMRRKRIKIEKQENLTRENLGKTQLSDKEKNKMEAAINGNVIEGQKVGAAIDGSHIGSNVSKLIDKLKADGVYLGEKDKDHLVLHKVFQAAHKSLTDLSAKSIINQNDANEIRAIGENVELRLQDKFQDLKNNFDDAMAAVVATNIIKIQRTMGVPKEKSLEAAMHSEKDIKQVFDQIKQLNARQPEGKKLWDCNSMEGMERSLTQENVNTIVKHILDPRVEKELMAAGKNNANPEKNASKEAAGKEASGKEASGKKDANKDSANIII